MTRLHELRKEKDYTQIKMQFLTGIDQSCYSKLERGEKGFSFEQCKRVAIAFETSMDYLAELTNVKAPHERCTQEKDNVVSRVRELREEKGYTQVKMQLLTGIDQSNYSKIECGDRYLNFEQCKRIAVALDTSMDYLAGLTNIKTQY